MMINKLRVLENKTENFTDWQLTNKVIYIYHSHLLILHMLNTKNTELYIRCNATAQASRLYRSGLLWFFTDARLWTNVHVSLLAMKHLVLWFCSVCTSSHRCAYIPPPTEVWCVGNSINSTINLEGVHCGWEPEFQSAGWTLSASAIIKLCPSPTDLWHSHN